MPPTIGDTIFVTEVSPYDETETVSPALVTHVFTEDDGDPQWWKAAKDREIVEAHVFRRDGTTGSVTVGKIDEDNPTGYSTSPGGASTTEAATPQAADAGTPTTGASPANGGVGSVGDGAGVPGTPGNPDSVGDGSAPQGSQTNPDGTPAQPQQ